MGGTGNPRGPRRRRTSLCNSGSWLCDDSFAVTHTDSPTHSVSHATPHSATYATGHATRACPPTAYSGTWTCRSVQLCCGTVPRLGASQAAVVLRPSSHLWSADLATTPSGPLQL